MSCPGGRSLFPLHVLRYGAKVFRQDGGVYHVCSLLASSRECDAQIVGSRLPKVHRMNGWGADKLMRYPEALADKSFDNTGCMLHR